MEPRPTPSHRIRICARDFLNSRKSAPSITPERPTTHRHNRWYKKRPQEQPKQHTMKKLLIAFLIAPFCAFAADKPAKAEKPAAPKAEKADKYQVTGPVAEVSDTKIVVLKGTERFEVARTADTKVTGDLKVGAKVTIKYVMTAATVDVKADDKKEAPAKSAKPDKAAKTDKPATADKTEKAPATN